MFVFQGGFKICGADGQIINEHGSVLAFGVCVFCIGIVDHEEIDKINILNAFNFRIKKKLSNEHGIK